MTTNKKVQIIRGSKSYAEDMTIRSSDRLLNA